MMKLNNFDSKNNDDTTTDDASDHPTAAAKPAARPGNGRHFKVFAIFISFRCLLRNAFGTLMKKALAFYTTNPFTASFHFAAGACLDTGSVCFFSVRCFFTNAFGSFLANTLSFYNSNSFAMLLRFAAEACSATCVACVLGIGVAANVAKVCIDMAVKVVFVASLVLCAFYIHSMAEETQSQFWKDYRKLMFDWFTLVAECFGMAAVVVMVVVPYAEGGMAGVKQEARQLRELIKDTWIDFFLEETEDDEE